VAVALEVNVANAKPQPRRNSTGNYERKTRRDFRRLPSWSLPEADQQLKIYAWRE